MGLAERETNVGEPSPKHLLRAGFTTRARFEVAVTVQEPFQFHRWLPSTTVFSVNWMRRLGA